MKSTLKYRLVVSFAICFCFFLFSRTCYSGDKDAIQLEEYARQNGPETECKKYSYQYYPQCSVYFDIQRGLYFYREDDNWKIFSALPKNLERQLGDFVKIETDNDKPYLENELHVKKFPPDDSRTAKKKMWSKLAFLLLYKHAPH
jgi:hypothetical protein